MFVGCSSCVALCPLFVARCLSFVVSVFVVCCYAYDVVNWLLVVVRCVCCVVCCVLFDASRIVSSSWYGIYCLSSVVCCCLLLVVRCSLFVVCCVLFVVWYGCVVVGCRLL